MYVTYTYKLIIIIDIFLYCEYNGDVIESHNELRSSLKMLYDFVWRINGQM